MEMRPLTRRLPDGSLDRRLSVSADTVVLMPSTTEGPFFATTDDFYESADMTAAAVAGSPGVTEDRYTVLDAVPLTLTMNLFYVNGTIAEPMSGALIYIWCADAIGKYSAISLAANGEDTSGQMWLRSKATADSDGQLVIKTIVPGWYDGRTIHIHVKVSFPTTSNSTYAVTSQLIFNTTYLGPLLKPVAPYSEDTVELQDFETDSVYTSVDENVRPNLVLDLEGDVASGFTTTFNLGLDPSDLPEEYVDTNLNTGDDMGGDTGDMENMTGPGGMDDNMTIPGGMDDGMDSAMDSAMDSTVPGTDNGMDGGMDGGMDSGMDGNASGMDDGSMGGGSEDSADDSMTDSTSGSDGSADNSSADGSSDNDEGSSGEDDANGVSASLGRRVGQTALAAATALPLTCLL